MNTEWEELLGKIARSGWIGRMEKAIIAEWAKEIERRTLPERVAEIIEKAGTLETINSLNLVLGASITRATRLEIAKALRTGDLSAIKKWVKE